MLKGFKGVQYGLTVPGKKKKQAVTRPNALAAFGDDDSDGEHEAVPQQLARQAASKKSDSKVVSESFLISSAFMQILPIHSRIVSFGLHC